MLLQILRIANKMNEEIHASIWITLEYTSRLAIPVKILEEGVQYLHLPLSESQVAVHYEL